MFFRAMKIYVEVFWWMQLLLQPGMVLWRLSNVYLSPIRAEELAEAFLRMVGALRK